MTKQDMTEAGASEAKMALVPPALPKNATDGAALAAASRDRPGDEIADLERLRAVLFDSRQRWREFAALACDFVFEIDHEGCFSFVGPELALGWPAATLVGRRARDLLGFSGEDGFDPFLPAGAGRNRRVWLRRADGKAACVRLSTAPLTDEAGAVIGLRGAALEITHEDAEQSKIATVLRRSQTINQIVSEISQETMATRMAHAGLAGLTRALGAKGGAVIALRRLATEWRDEPVRHQSGEVPEALAEIALEHLCRPQFNPVPPAAAAPHAQSLAGPQAVPGPGGIKLLLTPVLARLGSHATLLLWRGAEARLFDHEDREIVAGVTGILRLILEQEAIQAEMAREARSDPLTGLLNRRAFVEEVERRIDRLDREQLPGSLVFIDIDRFKSINDRLGHAAGDEALTIVTGLLRRTVRPSDVVARLGGDEFALWLDGADEFTSSERADTLTRRGPQELAHLAQGEPQPISLSIGIATRWPNKPCDLDTLMQRADAAMYEVKRTGRGHWLVARPPASPGAP